MERQITLPISSKDARDLRVGDTLYSTGTLFTARDEAHRLMLARYDKRQAMPFDPASMALFHCGPLVRKTSDVWHVLAAGPTTSIRMEPREDRFLDAFGTKIVIGKGGMGKGTQAALVKHGAVYAHYTGGAGALAAKAIERVTNVFWLEELGMAEAVWIFEVRRFGPLYVTMDSVGGNLYTDLAKNVAKNQQVIHAKIAGEGGRLDG